MVFRMALPFLPYREPEIVSSCPKLGRVFAKEAIKSVMIVTDKGIVNNGLTTPIEDVLKKSGVAYIMYDKTQPNPTVHNVEEVLAIYQQNHCDSLIAIGGGSSIDCAKAVGARLAHPRKSLNQLKGIRRVCRKLPILIAVPTTAGTGSEVTLASIITDSEKHHKYALCCTQGWNCIYKILRGVHSCGCSFIRRTVWHASWTCKCSHYALCIGSVWKMRI